MAAGHLAFDFCGWHPPHQGATLIFPDVSSGPSRHGGSRQRPRVNSTATANGDAGARFIVPPVTRSCDGWRPQGDHVIVHSSPTPRTLVPFAEAGLRCQVRIVAGVTGKTAAQRRRDGSRDNVVSHARSVGV